MAKKGKRKLKKKFECNYCHKQYVIPRFFIRHRNIYCTKKPLKCGTIVLLKNFLEANHRVHPWLSEVNRHMPFDCSEIELISTNVENDSDNEEGQESKQSDSKHSGEGDGSKSKKKDDNVDDDVEMGVNTGNHQQKNVENAYSSVIDISSDSSDTNTEKNVAIDKNNNNTKERNTNNSVVIDLTMSDTDDNSELGEAENDRGNEIKPTQSDANQLSPENGGTANGLLNKAHATEFSIFDDAIYFSSPKWC